MRIRPFCRGSVCLVFFLTLLCGCGRNVREENKVIATINGEPVYVKDLNRSIALNFKRNPLFKVTPQTLENQIDMLIDKRLLIQAAKNKKLDQTDRFINTIKTFWEQTLIRDLMSHKDNEMASLISVSDDEVKFFYDRLSHQKTFQIIRSKDRNTITELLIKDPESIQWGQTVGPVNYDDVSSDLIRKAFDVAGGKMRIFKDNGRYALVFIKRDLRIPVAPFDEMKDAIRQKIGEIKKQELFGTWLKKVRENARIKIDEQVLKGVKYLHG